MGGRKVRINGGWILPFWGGGVLVEEGMGNGGEVEGMDEPVDFTRILE